MRLNCIDVKSKLYIDDSFGHNKEEEDYWEQIGFDVKIVTNWDITCRELLKSEFMGYSSIIALTYFKNMTKIVKAMWKNESIQYLTKLLIGTSVYANADFRTKKRQHNVAINRFNNDVNHKRIDNLFFFALLDKEKATQLLSELCIDARRRSVQETVERIYKQKHLFSAYGRSIYQYTTPNECFIFKINPALAVIINHHSFRKLEPRVGSEKDLEALQQVFNLKRIPHIIIDDGNREEVEEMMAIIQNTDLGSLKYLFVIIMSHGDEGGIIKTKTDSYTIDEDIIKPLMSNQSLEDIIKYVAVNACRGNHVPEEDFKEDVKYVDTSKQNEKLIVHYSTTETFESHRDHEKGSYFIQELCRILEKPFNNLNMNAIAAAVEDRLYNNEVYNDFEAIGQVTEYRIKPGTNHTLSISFENKTEFETLLKNLIHSVYDRKNPMQNVAKRNL